MLTLSLLLLPVCGALISFFSEKPAVARWVLMITATVYTAICAALSIHPDQLHLTETLTLAADPAGFVVLAATAILFLPVSVYNFFWMPRDLEKNAAHLGMKPSTFAAILMIFVSTMTLTTLAQDFGMLWVAVEATTLASAPLINYHRSKGSLEAMWKYLLICSIGIGLALFGTMLLSASLNFASASFGFAAVKRLTAHGFFNPAWFKAGFVLCFAGYALKMGLAPFHTWLPDAHSEAPVPVSAMLSGSLLNCALLALLRLNDIVPSDLEDFAAGYFKFFGFFSLAVAAFFIIRQKDYKRMLAYSSVEHMGLIALLIGFAAMDYAMLHIISHSLIKMSLFLLAGNILLSYGTRETALVKGLSGRLPGTAAFWLTGILFICGTPPSPLFFTELVLVKEAGIAAGSAILALLLVIFCGMSQIALKMYAPDKNIGADPAGDKLCRIPAIALAAVSALGIAVAWNMIG